MRRRTSTKTAKEETSAKPAKTSAKDRAAAALAPSAKVVDEPAPAAPTATREAPRPRKPDVERDAESGYGDTRVSRLQMTGFETIIDNVFTFDPDAAYAEVIACLELGQKASRTDYGSLVDALDDAESNVEKALRLVANAKVTLVSYKADVDVILGQLHSHAAAEYQKMFEDPSNTEVTKKPTIADIEAYKMSTYHDEYADCQVRLEKAKRTVDYLEGLQKAVSERARDLRQMCASARGA